MRLAKLNIVMVLVLPLTIIRCNSENPPEPQKSSLSSVATKNLRKAHKCITTYSKLLNRITARKHFFALTEGHIARIEKEFIEDAKERLKKAKKFVEEQIKARRLGNGIKPKGNFESPFDKINYGFYNALFAYPISVILFDNKPFSKGIYNSFRKLGNKIHKLLNIKKNLQDYSK